MNKKELIKFLQNNEFDIQSARANLFACDLCFGTYVDSTLIKNAVINPIFCFVSNNKSNLQFYQITPEKILRNYIKKIFSHYSKNPQWLHKEMNKFDDLAKIFDEIWDDYQKNKKILTQEELLVFFDKIISIFRKNMVYWSFGEDKGTFISEKIINFLVGKHKLNELEARKIVGILTHPDFLSVLNKERIEYLSLCLYVLKKPIKNNKELLKDGKLKKTINLYIKNYFWIKTDFYIEKYITPDTLLNNIRKEIKKKKSNEINLEVNSIKNSIRGINRKKKRLLSKLNLSDEEKKNLSFISYIVSRQDKRKEYMMKHFFYSFSFIRDAAKRMKVSYDYLSAHSVDDLRKIIIKGGKIKTKFGWHFIIFSRGKKNKIFYGQDAKKLFGALKVNSQKTREIKGTVASRDKKDKIRGVVKIVSNPNEQKLNKGEILVTSMTRTEFLPIMRRAKAIITNEGGIASHAAIVSRELGIPCVIGTKNATRVLKDGDLIEINMVDGIIKLIK